MHQTLLTTKLYFPPVRSSLVSRPRLVERLHTGLQGPLTLISAPAGYGKTTLMSEWRAGVGCDYSIAWLSLDRDDNDSTSFLMYIIAALATLKPGFGETTLALLQSSPPLSTRVILTSLINELGEVDKTLSLVLDDYHVITNHPIHEAVTYLLDHLPSQMHLVILTRVDPPLPLSRLRTRGQLTEIRAADLCFTFEETAAFLNQVMGLALSVDQVGALEQRTEGWVAGLQLAALSMQGREDVQNFISAFTGSHHYIVDYLADEVLNSQPKAVQEFLLRTSILDRLTAPLCDALTDRSDGQTTIEKLEHTNLFLIPLDDEQRWYRYHHLFLEVLRKRLGQTYPDSIPGLHRRAAEWFEQQNLIEEALTHYLMIKNFDQATRLLSYHWWLIFKNRTLSSILAVMKNFPDIMIRTHPRLSLIYAWNLWLMGLRNEAEPYVLNAYQAILQRSRLSEEVDSPPAFNALLAETTAFRSLIAIRHGELATSIKYAKQAVKTAPADEYYTRGIAYISLYNAYREMGRMEDAIRACTLAIKAARLGQNPVSTVDAIFNLGGLLKIQGHLHRAAQVYWEGLNVAENQGLAQLPAYSLIHFGLANVFYQWNNLDETEHHLALGFKLLEQNDDLLISRLGYINLAQLKRARGDIQGALKILREIELEAQKKGMTTLMDEVVTYKVRLQAELGYAAEVVEWANTIEIGTDEQLGYQKGLQAIQLARVFIALGNLDEALDLLSRIEKSAEAGKNISWQIEALLLQAIAWQMKDGANQAEMRIEKALQLAMPEGYIRIFLEEGELIRMLIADYRSQIDSRLQSSQGENLERLKTYATKLLLAFPQAVVATSQPAISTLQSTNIESLSERELEVLRFVAEGKSNQQIADALILATGTVKKHLNNIYGKLGVQSRTQCVARARELNLL